jgi:ribonuclease HII
MPNPRWTHDRKLVKGVPGVVGVDEAGRGCLAGPVVAGCTILPSSFFADSKNRKAVEKINDSKQFSEMERDILFQEIQSWIDEKKLFGATGSATIEEIEKHNIVGATCLAMQRAMEAASVKSEGLWLPSQTQEVDLFTQDVSKGSQWRVVVDGRSMKRLPIRHMGLIKGDTISLAVAMASLLAKVTRDQGMRQLDQQFPHYGFASNKGYGVPVHLKALEEHGITEHHRPRFLRNIMKEPKILQSNIFEQSRLSLA